MEQGSGQAASPDELFATWCRGMGIVADSDEERDARSTFRATADQPDRWRKNALTLAAALKLDPPPALGELSPRGALGLAVVTLCRGLAWGEMLTEGAPRVRANIVEVYRESADGPSWSGLNQMAAARAVRELGGPRQVFLPEWVLDALDDTETWTACDDLMRRVELACENAAPGMEWAEVPHLGVILYRLS